MHVAANRGELPPAMASANPEAAEAKAAAGQRDELAESLDELFTNVSLMVRGELQVPLPLHSNRTPRGRSASAPFSLHCQI